MPRGNPTRQQIVSRAIQARRPRSAGGTTAPRSAAGGGRMGLGQRQPARQRRAGIGSGKAIAGPGAAGPGGSAGAMAPNTPAPTPWNTKAEQIVSGARRSYLNQGIGFDLSEQQAKQEFGLDPGFNDYQSNPFSRAALLEESFRNANRGTVNSAGLQLYSGSTSNALGSNRNVYGRNRNELANVYREALGEISAGRAKAAEEKAERERAAEWERISAAEAAPLEPEATPGGQRKQQPKRRQQQRPAVGRGRKAR